MLSRDPDDIANDLLLLLMAFSVVARLAQGMKYMIKQAARSHAQVQHGHLLVHSRLQSTSACVKTFQVHAVVLQTLADAYDQQYWLVIGLAMASACSTSQRSPGPRS